MAESCFREVSSAVSSSLSRLVSLDNFQTFSLLFSFLGFSVDSPSVLELPIQTGFDGSFKDRAALGLKKGFLLSAAFLSAVNNHDDDDDANISGDTDEGHEGHDSDFGNEGDPVSDDDQGEEPCFDFLLNQDELETVKVEYIDGDKTGSNGLSWMIFTSFINMDMKGKRRLSGSVLSVNDDDDQNPKLSYAYKLETHECTQTKAGPIMQKFRTKIKKRMQTEYKNKFRKKRKEKSC